MSSRVLSFALLLTLCCAAVPLRAEGPRFVFAHYMLANRDYAPNDPSGEQDIAAYAREIRQAQSIGIDGFALNAGGWFKEPWYIRRASEMFEAAVRLHTGFTLFFSADMCCFNDAADVEDMVRRFANNPRYAPVYFRDHGKFLLTTFAGSSRGPEFWRAVRIDLEGGTHPSLREAPCAENLCPLASVRAVPSNASVPIRFVPAFFFGGELPQPADIAVDLKAYDGILDGAFYWGIAGAPGLGQPPDQLPPSEAYAAALHRAGKLYMAPICFQFYGTNAGRYYEYSGYTGMRNMWMNAINTTHPDWIEIITWNDFVEGTYISPIRNPISDAPATSRFPDHGGATQLLAFFISWYKTGRQPVIERDEVYWAYRTRAAIPASKDMKLYGPVADVIYVTTNLSKPAKLRISFGSHFVTKDMPAGSSDLQIPLTTGFVPRFELDPGTPREAHADGSDAIHSDGSGDLYYSAGFMSRDHISAQ